MPLIHSSSQPALKENIKTLMGEVGKSPHVQSREQALAVAFATKRRGKAFGGAMLPASSPNAMVRSEARDMVHTGPIVSTVPGRTDRHNMSVPSGSYVIPAETISHMGQSNSMAGLKIAHNVFGSQGPFGVPVPHLGHGIGLPRPPRMSDAGGARGEGMGEPTPVVTAGGEYVIPPEVVSNIGGGNLKQGHKILDAWVMDKRKEHIRTLKKLPAPVKS